MANSIDMTFNVPLRINGVPTNLPVTVGISIGEPKIVTDNHEVYQPRKPEREYRPPERPWNERYCFGCGCAYLESWPYHQWPTRSLCPLCEVAQYDYQSSAPQPKQKPPHNWQEEGF